MEFEIRKKSVLKKNEKNTSILTQKGVKVAAYARVSTDMDEQHESFESQRLYYKKKIEKNENWIFVGVYADEAKSGTQTIKRINFIKMINDALDGKIDLILTKSVSRFARNTVDSLEYVRKLKEKNVAIYFEEENINTLDMQGELLLTILSSLAQQEIENLSSHVSLALKMRMKRGDVVGMPYCYGFDYDADTQTISINEEEAKVVRKIFNLFLNGYSYEKIRKRLAEENIKSIRGHNMWDETVIKRILSNVKYRGDLLQGKYYTNNPMEQKHKKNEGERDMYLVKNHHEAIISKEDFDKAQIIVNYLKKRTNMSFRTNPQSVYPCSGLFYCGFCGERCGRRINYQKAKYACNDKNNKTCGVAKGVNEDAIENAFVDGITKLKKKIKNNSYGKKITEKLIYIKKILFENESEDNDKKIDISLIKEILDYGIIGGYENEKVDYFLVRFILKTEKQINRKSILPSDILEIRDIAKCGGKLYPLLDFYEPSEHKYVIYDSEGKMHRKITQEIRVRFEIECERRFDDGNNDN